MRSVVLFSALLCLVSALVSCDPAARSASQALDNANGAIKTSGDKLFMEPGGTPTPAVPTR